MKNIRASGETISGDNCEINVTGLLPEEHKNFLGMLAGCYWVKVEEGRLKIAPALQEPPAPTKDESMMPYWFSGNEKEGFLKRRIFGDKKDWPPFSPSFIIQHLCGYHWTPGFYKSTAEKLESFGFECMRSRRGVDGKFWEVWFLPGLWVAEGDFSRYLKRLEKSNEKTKLEKAIGYLCRNVSFGSLDVVAQRAAMVVETE